MFTAHTPSRDRESPSHAGRQAAGSPGNWLGQPRRVCGPLVAPDCGPLAAAAATGWDRPLGPRQELGTRMEQLEDRARLPMAVRVTVVSYRLWTCWEILYVQVRMHPLGDQRADQIQFYGRDNYIENKECLKTDPN